MAFDSIAPRVPGSDLADRHRLLATVGIAMDFAEQSERNAMQTSLFDIAEVAEASDCAMTGFRPRQMPWAASSIWAMVAMSAPARPAPRSPTTAGTLGVSAVFIFAGEGRETE